MTGIRSADLRLASRAKLLGALISHGRSSRGVLAERTGLSKATVSRLIEQLSREGIVQEGERLPATGRGPRQTSLEIVEGAGVVCGVDLGATNVRFVLTDLGGRLLRVVRAPIDSGATTAQLGNWLVDHVLRLCRENSDHSIPWATAIGVPGVVHPESDAVKWAPNLPAIEGEAFATVVRSGLKGAVSFDNDANLAVLGELHFGAARACHSAVMLTIGTGVGAGVVVDGQLVRGKSGFVGEFGYMVLAGPELTSLEQVVSGPSLIQRARQQGVPVTHPSEVFSEPATPLLRDLRQQVQTALISSLSAFVCAYEPEVIVLGGGVAASLEPWLGRLQAALAERVPMAPPIVLSQLDDLAGTLGAVVLGLEKAYARLGLALQQLTAVSAITRLAAIAPHIKEG